MTNNKRRLCMIFILLISFVVQACSKNPERIRLAAYDYQRHHYKDAIRHLRYAADKGDADAQYALGYMYYYGKGIQENIREARIWFGAAAKQGHPDALKALKLIN